MFRRLFASVMPSPDVSRELTDQLALHEGRAVRWTDPTYWHVTLLFTPQVDEEQLPRLLDGLGRLAASTPDFPLALAGGGAFPELAAARHLIALLDDPTGSLPHLATGCRAVAGELGIEHRDGPYRPHLTLARINRPQDCTADQDWLQALHSRPWRAGRISLIESQLQPSRPSRYLVLAQFPFTA